MALTEETPEQVRTRVRSEMGERMAEALRRHVEDPGRLVPQTDAGVQAIYSALRAEAQEAERNGLIAPLSEQSAARFTVDMCAYGRLEITVSPRAGETTRATRNRVQRLIDETVYDVLRRAPATPTVGDIQQARMAIRDTLHPHTVRWPVNTTGPMTGLLPLAGLTSRSEVEAFVARLGGRCEIDEERRELRVWGLTAAQQRQLEQSLPAGVLRVLAMDQVRWERVVAADGEEIVVRRQISMTPECVEVSEAVLTIAHWLQSWARWQPPAPPPPAWRRLLAAEPLFDRALAWWRERERRRRERLLAEAKDRHAESVNRALVEGTLQLGTSGLPVEDL